MKYLYYSIALIVFLIVVIAAWLFLGPFILDRFISPQPTINNNIVEPVVTPVADLNKEEKVELLNELAPANPVDTPEEIDATVKLLDQLSSGGSVQVTPSDPTQPGFIPTTPEEFEAYLEAQANQ